MKEPGLLGRLAGFARRHGVATGVAIAFALAAAVFVVVWFEPQQLFLEKTVNEAAPTVATTQTATAAPQTAVLSQGSFIGLEHQTTGTAKIVRLADGNRILRFENLDTSNGPDLVVYLSPATPDPNDWKKYAAGAVNLGELKGNRGNQNYAIPASLDLTKYRSAVIWCRRFTVGFGAAPIRL